MGNGSAGVHRIKWPLQKWRTFNSLSRFETFCVKTRNLTSKKTKISEMEIQGPFIFAYPCDGLKYSSLYKIESIICTHSLQALAATALTSKGGKGGRFGHKWAQGVMDTFICIISFAFYVKSAPWRGEQFKYHLWAWNFKWKSILGCLQNEAT